MIASNSNHLQTPTMQDFCTKNVFLCLNDTEGFSEAGKTSSFSKLFYAFKWGKQY